MTVERGGLFRPGRLAGAVVQLVVVDIRCLRVSHITVYLGLSVSWAKSINLPLMGSDRCPII